MNKKESKSNSKTTNFSSLFLLPRPSWQVSSSHNYHLGTKQSSFQPAQPCVYCQYQKAPFSLYPVRNKSRLYGAFPRRYFCGNSRLEINELLDSELAQLMLM